MRGGRGIQGGRGGAGRVHTRQAKPLVKINVKLFRLYFLRSTLRRF